MDTIGVFMSKSKIDDWDVDAVTAVWDEGHTEDVWDEQEAYSYIDWPCTGEMTALLDADMFPYIVGYCHSEEKFFEALRLTRERTKAKENTDSFFKEMSKLPQLKPIKDHVHSLVNTWTSNAECDSCVCFLTAGKKQYRFKLAFSKQYKNRDSKKPPFFEFCRWYIQETYETVVCTKNEADDEMAIWQYQANELLVQDGAAQGSKQARLFSGTCIVTKDKDLRMIPGWHSNPNLEKGSPFWVDRIGWLEPKYDSNGKMTECKGAGLKFFFAQVLMGDPVDTYPGLPFCGPVAAYDLLNGLTQEHELKEAVLEKYAARFGKKMIKFKAYTGEKVYVDFIKLFVEQARLAWMQTCRDELYMSEVKLPKIKWKRQFKVAKRGSDG